MLQSAPPQRRRTHSSGTENELSKFPSSCLELPWNFLESFSLTAPSNRPVDMCACFYGSLALVLPVSSTAAQQEQTRSIALPSPSPIGTTPHQYMRSFKMKGLANMPISRHDVCSHKISKFRHADASISKIIHPRREESAIQFETCAPPGPLRGREEGRGAEGLMFMTTD
eukprot:6214047-Pleurochrysis_carterae.AAC.2